ncbi:MAG TPA: HD domain-containing protein [Niabella sp.]|nr:HD domain-containing protein [Niabella sp.]
MDESLNKIIVFTDKAHGHQTRKYTPDRYIVHPVRVMQLCQVYTNQLPLLAAALLHDVLEDTTTTEADIHTFLLTLMPLAEANKTVQLVKELTDIYTKERYPLWNRHKRRTMEAARLADVSGDAQTIKYADIIDNSKEIIPNAPGFAHRFLTECKAILLLTTKGNAVLRQMALEHVNDGLDELVKNKRIRSGHT